MSRVESFYDEHSEYEWERLERHRMEFSMNLRMLEEYLPKPPARVLDVGGGPGRYAIHLSQAGYEVTLLDLSANNLALARRKAGEANTTLAGVVHGNALDLGVFAPASFDAVLVMGPLYHLATHAERHQALRQAHRVLKPGGVAAVAFINRYARIRSHQADWTVRNLHLIREELTTGRRLVEGFTDSWSIHPTEVRPLLEEAGFTFLDMIASEGLRSDSDGPVNHLTGEDWDAWIDLNYRIGKDPTVHGASIHLLAVARKS